MRYLYTAVTGGVDVPEPPGPVPDGWRAVYFTDGEEAPGWEVRPLTMDVGSAVRSARAHKLLAHRVLPDAEISLWVDGNIRADCDLDELVDRSLCEHDVAFHPHPERNCVYDEALACIEFHKDDPATIMRHVLGYALIGHPERWGLPETGVVLRRHTMHVAAFNERWWAELQRGSHRDQLSVSYALRQKGLTYATVDSDLRHGPLFNLRPHGVRRDQLVA